MKNKEKSQKELKKSISELKKEAIEANNSPVEEGFEKYYLTVKKIEERLESLPYIEYRYSKFDYNLSGEMAARLDHQPVDVTIEKLLSLPEDDVEFLASFTNIFDKNNPDRYKLLNRLIDICENDIVGEYHDYESRNVQHVELTDDRKWELLQKSFDIFKRLRNRDAILTCMFYEEIACREDIERYGDGVDDEYNGSYCDVEERISKTKYDNMAVTDYLLNERHLLSFLRDFLKDRKKDSEYKHIIKKFFPNIKNKGR